MYFINNKNDREFDSNAFLTMALSIIIIVGIIAVFSVINSDKKIVLPKQQIRQGLSDIVN